MSGEPLAPVLSWQDRRNATLVDALSPHAASIQHITGLVLSPHYGASKMRWCLEHVDAVRVAAKERTLRSGPLATYLLRSLLRERPEFVDPANASRTLLWDTATRTWSPQLLDLFEVPAAMLPMCVPNAYRFGTLQFGSRGIPMHVCTGDQNAAVFADGSIASDSAFLNVGTGAFLLGTSPHDPGDIAPLLRSVLWSEADQSRYALEGTVNGAGSALDWFAQVAQIDAHAVARELTHVGHEKNLPVFVNGISGVGSPFWRPHQRSYFQGAASAELGVAAILESIAFLLTENFLLLRKHAAGLKRIRATGGLTESDYLCACIAALCEVPVERSVQPEATARGLAYLCADMPKPWHRAAATVFAPRAAPALSKRYGRWRELMSMVE
jgi:glycerol kinase